MADKKVSELDPITGADTAADDLFLIVDASGSVTKKITRAELNNAIEQDVLSTVDINGGTIDNTVIGGTTPAAGDFTTLGATGNITVGGTVDGRDVAADGTKLDGIATSATANPNAIDNVVEDTSPQLGGDLQSNGNDITFADNDKVIFGAGNLEIFYDGTDSVIKDTGTGNLVLTSNGGGIFFRNNEETETYANFNNNGSVQLRYDNGTKFETTATGADITGVLTSDGLSIQSTSNDSTVNTIQLAPSTTTNVQGGIGVQSGGIIDINAVNFAGLRVGGTRYLQATSGGDISFYSSDGTTQGLFWDASTQRLGLGTTAPNKVLHLETSGETVQRMVAATNNLAGFYFGDSGNGSIGQLIYDNSSDAMRFNTNGAERMRIDSSGNVAIGVSSPEQKLHISGSFLLNNNTEIRFKDSGGTQRTAVAMSSNDLNIGTSAGGNLKFYNGSSYTERMRIDGATGDLLVGKTSSSLSTAGCSMKGSANVIQSTRASGPALEINRLTSDGEVAKFYRETVTKGSISVNASGTTYNTTSDIRLKTDIAPIADATETLMAMNAVTHKWKADPDADAVVGFIAQEMAEIVPEAVSKGEGEDDMWSMDYGRITPVLVAALQDAYRKIEDLESRIAALEAN